MKRFSLFSVIFTASTLLVLNAADSASVIKASRRLFGFSPDSRHYIYLESSRNPVTNVPTAQIQIFNVATNSCVEDGCLETEYDTSSSTTSNRAAEDELLSRTLQLRHALRLTQLKVGIPLPIISRTSGSGGTETVRFRLNNQTQPLEIRLEQRYMPAFAAGGNSSVERAAMRLIVNYDYRQLTLGDLNNYREAVKKYSIREVRLSPNRQNVVVLIDMTQPTYEGVLQNTFVQSFPIE